ncbi:BadF/BadG/BcrA/BcrD ATPase family protein [Thalassobius sp. Cn5-15]|uniref:BadF/BadG/BcrA/BcrD ATPase family protein n=1 Tax=Thalassobius sp. Cn5-15 TaxID=2917763 RepID=UPI001EF2903A|nr:BadF/BadG/BcrA/BcrD ATPase family protein [Thalassobius sp. Cn5-15]MCG7493090.1 ATPase [Thalassobius sp. Cn5-15]
MTNSQAKASALGVDGGGSRCRLLLERGDGARFAAEVGSANASSDFAGACAELSTGLTEVAQAAGLTVADLAGVPAFLGLAGVNSAALAAKVAAQLPLNAVHVEEDTRIALRAAIGAADGVVAHCGTGSFLGLQRAGRMRFVGGWGLTLGDEASAGWLGRRALSVSLQAADGLVAVSGLSDQILAEFEDAAGVMAWAVEARPADFGRFAPFVTTAAAAGDALALGLMQEGADYIAKTTYALGWRVGQALCLTGGIGPHYAALLPDDMQAALQPAVSTPLEAALDMAQALGRDGFARGALL